MHNVILSWSGMLVGLWERRPKLVKVYAMSSCFGLRLCKGAGISCSFGGHDYGLAAVP
jgi:hypothetical protein